MNKFSGLFKSVRQEQWLILLCFILAFLSWQGIHRNLGHEDSISNVSVDVDVPEGWAVWEKSVHRANIEFRGSREDIRYLNNTQLRIVIPVAEPKQGEDIHIKLTEKYLKNPTRAKVVSISPSEIVVKLDQEIERMLPVKAALSGSLPEGIEADRVVCSPASVRVSGARQVLDRMDNIHTETIELKDRQLSFKESFQIALPQEGRIRVDPDWVSVDFSLVQRSSTEEFELIPIQILCAPKDNRNISVQPQNVTITVKGQIQRIEQLRKANLFAYVSCTELIEKTGYDLPVIVDLPSGLTLVKIEPAVAHIEIEN